MRLDKFLCDNNIGTRSQVKEYIKKGQVAINGQIVKKPETKVIASVSHTPRNSSQIIASDISQYLYFYMIFLQPGDCGL